MQDFFSWRRIFGIIGLLIIGGIASSISDIVFKPLIFSLSDFFLSVATLGLSSVRDGMYLDVARGNPERTGAALLSALSGFQIGSAISLLLVVALASRPNVFQRLKEWRGSPTSESGRFKYAVYGWMMLLIISTGFVTVSNIRVLYTVRAANYLEQMEQIISPRLTVEQRIDYKSRAAQMTRKSDFVAIVDDLKRVAEANRFSVPAFDIF